MFRGKWSPNTCLFLESLGMGRHACVADMINISSTCQAERCGPQKPDFSVINIFVTKVRGGGGYSFKTDEVSTLGNQGAQEDCAACCKGATS